MFFRVRKEAPTLGMEFCFGAVSALSNVDCCSVWVDVCLLWCSCHKLCFFIICWPFLGSEAEQIPEFVLHLRVACHVVLQVLCICPWLFSEKYSSKGCTVRVFYAPVFW